MHLWLAQTEILHPAPKLPFPGHRLNVAVPLPRERGQAKLHSGAHFIRRRLIDSKLPDRINLAIAVAFVLGGMELVSLRCTLREAVVPGELAVNFLRNFPRSTELALDKREHGDAFESGAALATPNDH